MKQIVSELIQWASSFKIYFCTGVGWVSSLIIHDFLGGADNLLFCLLVLMATDILTGVLVAVLSKHSPKSEHGKLSSKAFSQGLVGKIFMLCIVGVANILDLVLAVDIVRNAMISSYIVNEALSILENAALVGVPVPDFVRKVLDVLNERSDDLIDQI